MQTFLKKISKIKTSGFTVFELLVTFTIFSLITAVVLYENHKFDSSILLTNLSYQMALSIRQAQVYGLSSKQVSGFSGSEAARKGYGVHFNLVDDGGNRRFIFFADTNDTGANKKTYQQGEEISTTLIGQNNQIAALCFKRLNLLETCNISSGNANEHKATIVFQRPNAEPSLRDVVTGTSIEYIKIVLSPINDATKKRCVIVNAAGQISVKGQSSC